MRKFNGTWYSRIKVERCIQYVQLQTIINGTYTSHRLVKQT